MVDFRKRLGNQPAPNPVIPSEIYDGLDRSSDKGPLRNVQATILDDWFSNYRDKRDVVLKLHTGQGKTLLGLLILQSVVNDGESPALYLCPNKHLVKQTTKQAAEFGFKVCEMDDDFPQEFLDGQSILVSTVHKLFNGLTKFRLSPYSQPVATIVLDDAHACVDAIRDSLRIRIEKESQAYVDIRALFEASLREQGAGTFADIVSGSRNDILPVPYWEWRERQDEILAVLARNSESKAIKFAWEILKNDLVNCQCVVGGEALEIEPYLPPLHLFGTYANAKHRVFMSATVTNDAFLVKGLGLSRETIANPLMLPDEKWSGEKMVLIPSLINEAFDQPAMVKFFGTSKERKFGTVALVPSFKKAESWTAYGAVVATGDSIEGSIEQLKSGNVENTLVIVNRYDGIDLPDNACRILVFDSKPYSENLVDRHSENCRASSQITAIRSARTIEQGLGRSVRGEKDFCVIVVIGEELVKSIRSLEPRKHLSNQTNRQIDIGLEIAALAREEIEGGTNPERALIHLINQCLRRDEDWKAFYIERMDAVSGSSADEFALTVFESEHEAEKLFQRGDIDGAVRVLQTMLDQNTFDELDKGWYLQEIARYLNARERIESNKTQVTAHGKNRFLLKPRTGMVFKKISLVNQRRMENIIGWIRKFPSFEELSVDLDDVLSSLSFGVKADRFEAAIDDLATILGFVGERPEKHWKAGPDNLWALNDTDYLIVECKSEVDLIRQEISKYEADQMNTSCNWFETNYYGANADKIMIIPTKKLGRAASFTDPSVRVMDRLGLEALRRRIRTFFQELRSKDLNDLSEAHVQELINAHDLSPSGIVALAKPFVPYQK
ncbi:MAG: DEAD/DEAH box helicase [Acidobacteria bacterium]|nr:DEAD/DEAH box helicase [Acidobacteriota bacterium]